MRCDTTADAVCSVQPSAKREGFATMPEVTWEDVGALQQPRRELEEAITLPLLHPELCKKLGIPTPPGVLLFGPPGCGKTLLAKAVANSSAANFISVKGPELLNKFVGESERAVRQVRTRRSPLRANTPLLLVRRQPLHSPPPNPHTRAHTLIHARSCATNPPISHFTSLHTLQITAVLFTLQYTPPDLAFRRRCSNAPAQAALVLYSSMNLMLCAHGEPPTYPSAPLLPHPA